MVLHSPGCGRVGRRRHSTLMGCAPDFRVRGISHFRTLFRSDALCRSGAGSVHPFPALARGPPGPGVEARAPSWSRTRSRTTGGPAHLARFPATSHPLQGLRGRRNVCDVRCPVRRARRLRCRSAVSVTRSAEGAPPPARADTVATSGVVPSALSRRACEVDEGCARRHRVARRALCAPRGPSADAGHVRRVRCAARGGHTAPPPGRPPPASVTSTVGGLRRIVSGHAAERRRLDAVRSRARVRCEREQEASGGRWCPLRSGGGVPRARVSGRQGIDDVTAGSVRPRCHRPGMPATGMDMSGWGEAHRTDSRRGRSGSGRPVIPNGHGCPQALT